MKFWTMWRNFLKYTFRNCFVNIHDLHIKPYTNYRCKRKIGFKTFLIMNTGATISITSKEKPKIENNLSFLNDVQKACSKNDNALKDLMNVLSQCMTEISREYQENLKTQIEIINKCTGLGPVGEHWDELIEYRVHATELRLELSKYEMLVQKVGQMAYNQAVTSLLSGIEHAMDLLEVDFNNLENMVTKLAKDNYQWESKLLYANRDSILHALQ